MSLHPRARVLSLDDDEDACEMLKVLMNPYGIDVTCVRSVPEARLMIKAESFDLYLLDAWLPHINGFEFCRELRELDHTTPVLFYSGAAYDADQRKGIAAGADAYITKPDVERLIETMMGLLAKAQTDDVAVRYASNPSLQAESSLSAPFFSAKVAHA